jgi:ATP-dependent Lhr-like helicase
MDLGEKGRLHSNLPDSREWRVVDGRNGATLGRVLTAAGAGDRFFLAGRPYEVVRAARGTLTVRAAEGSAHAPLFARRERGSFARFLPPDLRRRVAAPTPR